MRKSTSHSKQSDLGHPSGNNEEHDLLEQALQLGVVEEATRVRSEVLRNLHRQSAEQNTFGRPLGFDTTEAPQHGHGCSNRAEEVSE